MAIWPSSSDCRKSLGGPKVIGWANKVNLLWSGQCGMPLLLARVNYRITQRERPRSNALLDLSLPFAETCVGFAPYGRIYPYSKRREANPGVCCIPRHTHRSNRRDLQFNTDRQVFVTAAAQGKTLFRLLVLLQHSPSIMTNSKQTPPTLETLHASCQEVWESTGSVLGR